MVTTSRESSFCRLFRFLAGAAQNPFHELALGLRVSVAVATELAGQLTLQNRISVCIFRMASQMVSERDMPAVLMTAGYADIKVMRTVIGWRTKSFAAGYTQIALVRVSEGSQSRDERLKIGT